MGTRLALKPQLLEFEQYQFNIIGVMASEERRGRWKKTQKQLFLKGLNKYGKNWVQIQKIIKTRSVAQIRSHAQKIFLSMTKYEQRALDAELQGRFDDFCHPGSTNKSRKEKKSPIESISEDYKQLEDFNDNLMSGQILEKEIELEQVKIEAPEQKPKENISINQNDAHQTALPQNIASNPSIINLLAENFQRANIELMQELIRNNMKLLHF